MNIIANAAVDALSMLGWRKLMLIVLGSLMLDACVEKTVVDRAGLVYACVKKTIVNHVAGLVHACLSPERSRI